MPDRLITLRSYYDLLDAEMAVNLLRSEGVPAFLADSKFVSTTWHLANAVQGIKLQVRAEDEEKARYFLGEVDMARNERRTDWEQDPDEDLDDEFDDDEFDESEHDHLLPITGGYARRSVDEIDDETPPNPAEANAERAFKGAAFGLLFLPLQFYVTFLLADILFSGRSLRPRYRRKALLAGIINVIFLVLLTVYLRST
jgi:hypothetical protein